MDGHSAGEALALVRAGVDGLLSDDLSALPGVELAALIRALEAQRRRLEAVDQRLIAEAAERGLAGEYGRAGPADLLVSLLRITPGEAKSRVGRSVDLAPRHTLTGQRLEPILPVVADAVRAGEISAHHVAVISDTIDRIPAPISHEVTPVAERLLVEAARHEHPKQLAKTAALLLARIDPDGAAPRDRETERRREFTLHKHQDGSSEPCGLFTAELTALLETVLDALAAPAPAAEGMVDERTPGQRRHDGLADAMTRLMRSGTLPDCGGVPVTLLARSTISELAASGAVAVTGHGDQLSLTQLLQMAGDAAVIPVVCDQAGGVLAYGRGRRLASRGQRLALAARDGGCCFPGCDRPATWAEVHHVVPWLDGGGTDLDNLCLICRYHHREFAARGWEVVMLHGAPHWIPPPFIDPGRTPVRNTAHHLADFDFATSPRAG